MTDGERPPLRDPGSFRDPSGFIVSWNDRLFRAVSSDAYDELSRLSASGVLPRLEKAGTIIGTRLAVDEPSLAALKAAFPEAQAFVEHERLEMVAYPYEWSFSMLCDAALLHLSLQAELLRTGLTLKDASAYNVQFVHARPVFIDLPSIARSETPAVWDAYSQFCGMFLFPLLLSRHGRMDRRAYYLLHPNGLEAEEAARSLGWWRALQPANFIDVFLQRALQARHDGAPPESFKRPDPARLQDPAPQQFNLRRLSGRIRALREGGTKAAGRWFGYAGSYPDDAAEKKAEFVGRVLAEEKARTVVDLGCNKGRYSLIAARTAKTVVAVDSDESCVDALYNRAKDEKLPILPVWMDLARPSPGVGLANSERAPFLDRIDADAALALALVHHLLVSTGAPIEAVADYLYRFTTRALVVEFVGPKDPLFRKIVGLRPDLWSGLTQEAFVRAFERGGRHVKKVELTAHRSLHLFVKGR